MTYKWSLSPNRRYRRTVGKMIYTEALNMDEALEILSLRAASNKRRDTLQSKSPSMKQLFARTKTRSQLAADRKKIPKIEKRPDPFAVSSADELRQMIRDLYSTGNWNMTDLNRKFLTEKKKFGLTKVDLYEWVRGIPINK